MHNIIYTEQKLQKMNKSNGKCHFCCNEIKDLKHMFVTCTIVTVYGQGFYNDGKGYP